MSLTYLDRAAWGARTDLPRQGHVVGRGRFVGLAVHHTVMVMRDYDRDGVTGDVDDVRHYMRSLQTARPDLGLDVPYSFVVLAGATPDDAFVCEGRGFDRTGAHTAGLNSTRWGVALAGDFTHVAPTPGMLEAVRWIGRQLTATPVPTTGHRDHASTACPGNAAYPLLHLVQPPFGEDMTLTPDQANQLANIHHWVIQGLRNPVYADQDHPVNIPGRLDELGAAMPTALDVGALAEAIARRLPSGPGGISKAELVDAVKQALREGTAA